MKKAHGTEGVALQECINPPKDKWHIRADVQPYYVDGKQQGVTYWEEELDHEPTTDDWAAFEAKVYEANNTES